MDRKSLLHNPSNPVTVGIWLESSPDGPVVRKRIRGDVAARHPDWVSSAEPSNWLYWRREAEVLEAGLHQAYAPEGLRGPRLLAVEARPDGAIDLVVEAVDGRTGPDLGPTDLVAVARRLGCAQGRLAARPPRFPWLSQRFLADHIASKHVRYDALQDESCWSHPLIRATWPSGLRTGLRRLADRRQELLGMARAAPRTFCHLDLWSHNLFTDGDGTVVLDWACCGDGALGEDVSNLVIEAVLDELVEPSILGELGRDALDAYCDGVASSGWSGPREAVERGFHAAAVKWCWLGPLHLDRALSGEHHRYGGATDTEPEAQYHARGQALEQIVAWADAAT